MSLFEEQQRFYRERVPRQFNASLALQAQRADQDEEAARLLEEMRAVRASIRIEVECDTEPIIHHHLEIDAGVMSVVAEPVRTPFLVVRHALDQFPNLSRGCGASVLGFLGAMTGLGDDMKLTRRRIRSLRTLKGSLRFEVEGDEGFALHAGFGIDELGPEPNASIRLRPEIFDALRRGELDAQDAFFDEQIGVQGDMEIAIGAALAALSPE